MAHIPCWSSADWPMKLFQMNGLEEPPKKRPMDWSTKSLLLEWSINCQWKYIIHIQHIVYVPHILRGHPLASVRFPLSHLRFKSKSGQPANDQKIESKVYQILQSGVRAQRVYIVCILLSSTIMFLICNHGEWRAPPYWRFEELSGFKPSVYWFNVFNKLRCHSPTLLHYFKKSWRRSENFACLIAMNQEAWLASSLWPNWKHRSQRKVIFLCIQYLYGGNNESLHSPHWQLSTHPQPSRRLVVGHEYSKPGGLRRQSAIWHCSHSVKYK